MYSVPAGVPGGRVSVEEVGQMQADLARHGAEPRRIRRRLVDAGDRGTSRAPVPVGVGREPDDAADDEPSLVGELPRDQDVTAA